MDPAEVNSRFQRIQQSLRRADPVPPASSPGPRSSGSRLPPPLSLPRRPRPRARFPETCRCLPTAASWQLAFSLMSGGGSPRTSCRDRRVGGQPVVVKHKLSHATGARVRVLRSAAAAGGAPRELPFTRRRPSAEREEPRPRSPGWQSAPGVCAASSPAPGREESPRQAESTARPRRRRRWLPGYRGLSALGRRTPLPASCSRSDEGSGPQAALWSWTQPTPGPSGPAPRAVAPPPRLQSRPAPRAAVSAPPHLTLARPGAPLLRPPGAASRRARAGLGGALQWRPGSSCGSSPNSAPGVLALTVRLGSPPPAPSHGGLAVGVRHLPRFLLGHSGPER